jgi:RimJ/RimL family protein N-acetyltransferase
VTTNPARTLDQIWAPFGLSIDAGRLRLSPVRDEDIATLVELAIGGIHPPDQMPFYVPWSTRPPDELARNTAAYFWRNRSAFTPEHWTLDLAVRWDDELVGVQGFSTEQYLVTRTGETGSWLGAAHQGHGIGTHMRRVVCAFLFDHLDAEEVTSGAFVDNPASNAVSDKVGYQRNGRERRQRRPGEPAVVQRFRIEPQDLDRSGVELEVAGVVAFRRFIGLDA